MGCVSSIKIYVTSEMNGVTYLKKSNTLFVSLQIKIL